MIVLCAGFLAGCASTKTIPNEEPSPCACFEYEIFGGEKYIPTQNG